VFDDAVVIDGATTSWASVTFTGVRHRLVLDCAATRTLAATLAALPELDLAMPGQVVADIVVDRVEDRVEDRGARCRVTLSALTIADA
jgi:hypothetical protein